MNSAEYLNQTFSSFFKSLLNFYIKEEKIRFCLLIIELLLIRQIFVFQFLVFIIHPSLISFLMIFICFIISELIVNTINTIKFIINNIKFLIDIKNNNYKNEIIKTYTISELFSIIFDDNNKNIELYNILRNYRFIRLNPDKAIKIHLCPNISIWKHYDGGLPFESHIFINNIPIEKNKGSSIQLFFILHEISHSVSSYIKYKRASDSLEVYVVYLIWLLFFTTMEPSSLITILVYSLYALMFIENRKLNLREIMLFDEIISDYTALMFLSEKDIYEISKNKKLIDIINEKKWSSIYNSIRTSKLKENIEYLTKNKNDGRQDIFINIIEYIESIKNSYISLLSFLIITLLPSIYSIEQTQTTLLHASVVAAIIIIIFAIISLIYFLTRDLVDCISAK